MAKARKPKSADSLPTGLPPAPKPFNRKGAAYFWLFNDRCTWGGIERQLQAFATGGHVSAVCIHPRAGLLVPYGSDQWFALVREVARRAKELNIPVWLYDEDPYPSGNAGGRIVAENPGLAAKGLRIFTHSPRAQGDISIFYFPTGPLIWCGLVNEKTGAYVDLTKDVGVIRRKWDVHERWDSRYFYPDTPRYAAPRANTTDPEFAITTPRRIPPGMKLVALIAGRALTSDWGPFGEYVDSLNPEGTKLFLESTHEKYYKAVGDMFGNEIEAIFTDEPKCFDPKPWTPGLFADFQRDMGYDIRPYLHFLFNRQVNERALLTRLHYRRYVGERFRKAWLAPVAKWCRDHKLKLIGHISPEDDPVEQSQYVGNLLPLMKEFDLPGIDLIIPALGDNRHPVLNVGVTCATSIAHQQNKEGVMTETGAYSPYITAEGIGKILLWQCVMGVTCPVFHCAFLSTHGPRAYERPDFGPDGPLWVDSAVVRAKLAEVQEYTHGATQIAPVAIVWPIRTFNTQQFSSNVDHTHLRKDMVHLLHECLDRQVGTHFIDEADIPDLKVRNGWAVLGRAAYTHILIPSCTILHDETMNSLKKLKTKGIHVAMVGHPPMWQENNKEVTDADVSWCPKQTIKTAVAALPRLIQLKGSPGNIRCTAWLSPKVDGDCVRLLMNIGVKPCKAQFGKKELLLKPGIVNYVL